MQRVEVVCRREWDSRRCDRLLYAWSPAYPLADVPVRFQCDRCGADHRPPAERFRTALTTALAFGPPKVELPLPPDSPRYRRDISFAEPPEYRRIGPVTPPADLP